MKGGKRASSGLVVTIDDDVEVDEAAAVRQPASTSLHSSGTPGPSPSRRKLKPTAGVKKSRSEASQSSRGSKLLKVVELGGGTAADLGQALLKAGPQEDDIAILTAALKLSKRHDGDKRKSGSHSSTRRRSVDMLGVVNLGGGTPVALIDALMHDPEAEDMAVVRAALERASTGAGPSGGVKVEDAAQPQAPAGASLDSQAHAAAEAAAQPAPAPASERQKKQLCRVCRAQERTPGFKKTCADCATLILRLSKKSGGVCKRAHVRNTYAELGGSARIRDVKRRALQLAAQGQRAGDAAAAADDGEPAPADSQPPQQAAKAAAPVAVAAPAAARAGSSSGPSQREHSTATQRVAEVHVCAAQRPRVVKQEAVEAPAPHPSAHAAPPAEPAAAPPASPPAPPAAPGPPAPAPAAARASPPLGVPTPARSGSTTCDTELQGVAAAGAPPGAPGEAHAATSAPQRMCTVCAHQVCLPGGSYCVQCRSLASMIKRKGAIASMRAAYQELGIGAPRPAVKEFVKEHLDAKETRGEADKKRTEDEP